jgi:23S rRNA pseudouridine1911/1915/1917 synthase
MTTTDIPITAELLVDGARLDRVLMQSEPVKDSGVARSHVASLIKRGVVLINGVVATKSGQTVWAGDRITIASALREGDELVPYDIPLAVVFEDETVLVVDKPAGLTVHPGAGTGSKTLLNALVARRGAIAKFETAESDSESESETADQTSTPFGELERGGIVHRLDKDTSGLLVIAKTAAAHAHLARQFGERGVGRRYFALIVSTPRGKNTHFSGDTITIDAPIGRHPTQRTKMAVVADGRRAVTHGRIVERFSWALAVEFQLETGRTHQIRVHCAYRGAPIIGDTVYGNDATLPRTLSLAAQRCGRQALHAATLAFIHPVTGEQLSFTSPLPEELVTLVDTFRA